MADKFASNQAEERANELGVALDQIEGSGADGGATVADVEKAAGSDSSAGASSDEGKFLAFANPELGTYRAHVYPDDNPSNPRVFYRQPELHPDGPEAQMVTEEEFNSFNHTIDGVFTLARRGG